ncbi:MAG: SDR family oxidoreductase [Pseudomonadota bacterium]|jgi:NAD(P)-dependent dehydrogenase (short-subunit alcohol dehydrogenase family)|nr:SDR family oxidoreductase [Pseudomonadota bacterium]
MSDSVSRRALITGAGRGIGRGIALAFAKVGIDLALVDVLGADCERTAQDVGRLGQRALAIKADVGKLRDCEAAVDASVAFLGGLDVLVNCAIQTRVGQALVDQSEEDIAMNWETGALATFRLMKLAHPHLKASVSGSVINFGSGNGTEGLAGTAAYAASKEAVRALSKVAAREWGRDGIRVNTLCPFANSPGMTQFAEEFPAVFQATLDQTMLGRIGDCEQDIGAVAVFLASDVSSYVTGQTLMVDGGLHGFR